jgi:hypothetical protein
MSWHPGVNVAASWALQTGLVKSSSCCFEGAVFTASATTTFLMTPIFLILADSAEPTDSSYCPFAGPASLATGTLDGRIEPC